MRGAARPQALPGPARGQHLRVPDLHGKRCLQLGKGLPTQGWLQYAVRQAWRKAEGCTALQAMRNTFWLPFLTDPSFLRCLPCRRLGAWWPTWLAPCCT